ncbi:glycosyltransferase family 2 protein [Metabacillus arenae]|uniref:Glycosyltransferase family 2 protein n=1 Tax=Metabacillus arenae TaxID=2771434 RepID=A0A926NCF4_9BACI|nr:glycosyltransferase family 2 protein [Metabacillus arenae]MBD1378984.1 glycosyltransferase family 2 protein [Metabacillus arenae]
MKKRKKRNQPPLTSIIILTHNSLAYTKECISSIFQYTNEPFELILIDNGSTDGTLSYLTKLPNAKVIANQINRGFAGGCNQGLKLAAGTNIVLLNNDTVVTEGWLSHLLWWLRHNDQIGIVGPRSNFVLAQQAISQVPYKTIDEMKAFAKEWAKKHNKQGYETDQLSGFCMVFKKSLIEKIGGLDERFSPGYYEDTDFCIRAQISGKKLWVASDVFIHHYGSSSFKKNKEQHEKIVNESYSKFVNKWNVKNLHQLAQVVKREKPFNSIRHYVPY